MEKLKRNLGSISYNVCAINKNWEGEKDEAYKFTILKQLPFQTAIMNKI